MSDSNLASSVQLPDIMSLIFALEANPFGGLVLLLLACLGVLALWVYRSIPTASTKKRGRRSRKGGSASGN